MDKDMENKGGGTPDGNAGHGGFAPPDAVYPARYETEIETSGGRALLRPIRPADDLAMLRLFESFSLDTIYQRFFSYVTMTPYRVKRLTNIDYRTQMAIVAESQENGESILMGVARYNTPAECGQEADRCREAEMAIVVGDPWQGRGVGTALLRRLLQVGRDEGFEKLFGIAHYDNRAVPRLFEKLGQKHRVIDNGSEWRYEVLMSEVSGG